MFSMEEEEGSAKRPPAHCRGASQRTCSTTKSSASDDEEEEDEDEVIRPILDDSAKEICHYLKGLVSNRQLSNSLPKSSFSFRVSWAVTGAPPRAPWKRARARSATCSPTLVRRCGTNVKALCFKW